MKTKALALLLILALSLSLFGCELPLPTDTGNSGEGESLLSFPEDLIPTAFGESFTEQLNETEKYIYDQLCASQPGETSFSITLPEMPAVCRGRQPTDEEMERLQSKLLYWISNAVYVIWVERPDLFWLNGKKISIGLTVSPEEGGVMRLSSLTVSLEEKITDLSPEQEREASEELNALIAAYRPSGKTDADKVASINRFLCGRIEYDKEAPNRASAVGALIDGRCVCEGYAHAFALLAKKAGLTVISIPGDATSDGETEGHMWNAVKIDGTFYYVDSTWNDTSGEDAYLLVGGGTFCHGTRFDDSHEPNPSTEGSKTFVLPPVSETHCIFVR